MQIIDLLSNLDPKALEVLFGTNVLNAASAKLLEKNGKTYITCLAREKDVIPFLIHQ